MKTTYYAIGILGVAQWRFYRAECSVDKRTGELQVIVHEHLVNVYKQKPKVLALLWRISFAARVRNFCHPYCSLTSIQQVAQKSKEAQARNLKASGESKDDTSPAPPDPESIQVGARCISIQGRLGSGQEGAPIYRGVFEETQVAVKLHASMVEIEVLNSLEKHGCLGVQRVAASDGQVLVSKPVGVTLAALTKATVDGLSPSWVLRMTVSLLQSLRQIHRAGVLHRDLSPSNIVVVGAHDDWVMNGNLRYVLIDFGSSCYLPNTATCKCSVFQMENSHLLITFPQVKNS